MGKEKSLAKKSNKRVALVPHKQRIKKWVSDGKDDKWIGDALGASPASIKSFRTRHKIQRNAPQPSPAAVWRAKGVANGATTLIEIAEYLEQEAQSLREMAEHGVQLESPVEEDYAFLIGFKERKGTEDA